MTDTKRYTEAWRTQRWDKHQRNVFRLQKRIYRAAQRGDVRQVHNLQRLLLRSWSARLLAVRKVTQENRGKRTAGVDGVKNLSPADRYRLALHLRDLTHPAQPIRRVYIPKPSGDGQRALGIPVMADRARQALVKLALEPQWEAHFEPNSYGFRPGRSTHDAIGAIYNHIRLKPKFALETDIEACFDKISHSALLAKLHAVAPIDRLVRQWLGAGILDQGQWLFPETGTPQGGVISPLLMNIALHGLETYLTTALPYTTPPAVIRYADDVVILHEKEEVLRRLWPLAEGWLADMGLRLKASKTQLTHTLHPYKGHVGFDFLGFTIRQYPVGRYRTPTYRGQVGFKTLIKPSRTSQHHHAYILKQTIRARRTASQGVVIEALNPQIRGWTLYHRSVVAKRVFARQDAQLYRALYGWARRRHPRKTGGWCFRRYWRRIADRTCFADGENTLLNHAAQPIQRHVKVRSSKSPYDGDWVYWSARLGRHPAVAPRIARLLKQQQGRCTYCALYFTDEDVLEVHHKDGNPANNKPANLALLHGTCHDLVHAGRCE